MVAQTRGSGVGRSKTSLAKLQFKEKLISKGSSTDALLKKLKTLHEELAEMEQDRVDTKSLGTVRKELLQVPILLHKDKGVKAYVACCLADILRLYAPDAPYTADELRDIFQFFFRQLATGLKGANSPYYNEYFHLLQSLSTVKSVVLVCDLHHADELMADIFRDLFTLVRNDLAKNIEICVIDILVALIDEAQSVSHQVLDTIMAQFADEHTARLDQPAYRVAVEVCTATADKLQRYVCQYFTDIIIQHDLDETRHAHILIARINRDCPALLHNVVPQLEEELKVDELDVRLLATEALGRMFAEKGGGELAKKFPHVFEAWQGRKIDKAPSVRIAFVEACHDVIALHSELRKPIEDALRLKLQDPDDKVRAATCKVYAQLDYESALHYVSLGQLQSVGGRCVDKKHIVRAAAMNTLGKLYGIARPEIEKNDPAAITQFAWIPQTILHAAKLGPPLRVLAEQIFAQHILPLPPKGEDDATWTEQLVTVMKHLDESAKVTLLTKAGLRQSRPTIFERFIQCCEENNGGVIDANEEEITRRLHLVIQRIAVMFPDRAQVSEHLHSFAALNEARLYKLFKTCADVQTDLKALIKATNEFLRRVEQASPTLMDTMSAILRKASLWIINVSSIPPLVQAQEEVARAALVHIAKYCPVIYTPHVEMFLNTLKDVNGDERKIEVALQALAAMRWDGDERRVIERVIECAMGGSARDAKFATRIIAHMKGRDDLAVDLVSNIAKALPSVDEDLLVAHLVALAELAKAAPDAFETQSEVIVGFLLKSILMAPVSEDVMETDEEEEWGPVTPQIRAKILSLKICRNRCIAHAGGAAEDAMIVATPVLKMLFTVLANGGPMKEDVKEDAKVASRMRLQAATCLVQMAAVPVFCHKIMQNFSLLAVTIQDSCFHVRMGFLSKLVAHLSTNKVDPRFNAIVFLTAHDPERDVRDQTRTYVAFAVERISSELRATLFEMTFLRLLHLLAHHPDFAITMQNLQESAKYIEFYLDLVATADNVPLLFHLALKGKTVRDATEPEATENLYCISELAQEIIKTRAKLNGWQLSSYPGKVKLPSDIFKGLANVEVASKVLKTVYLPEDAASWLGTLKKTARSPNAKARGRPPGAVAKNGKKRKIPTKPRATGGTKRPQRKKRKADYDDDEDDDENDEDGSEDEDTASKSGKSSSSDEGEGGSGDDQLGRGARGRAKRRAKREAKKLKKDMDGK